MGQVNDTPHYVEFRGRSSGLTYRKDALTALNEFKKWVRNMHATHPVWKNLDIESALTQSGHELEFDLPVIHDYWTIYFAGWLAKGENQC